METFLEVPLSKQEYGDLKAIASRCGQSVDEWARSPLLKARYEQAQAVESKLQAIAEAAKHSFPSGDIEDILGEIEAGRNQPLPSFP